MEDDNEDNLKNKEDLHIAGRHMALDIFHFAVFFCLHDQAHNCLNHFTVIDSVQYMCTHNINSVHNSVRNTRGIL